MPINAMKKNYFAIVAFIVVACLSCSTNTAQEEYKNLFSDSHYLKGFNVSSVQEGVGETQGIINYSGKDATTPVWRISQWNNINNDILTGAYSNKGSLHTTQTEHGNVVASDTEKGSIVLTINTSSEYGLNGITSNPRKEGESWPHLLLESQLPDNEVLKISDKKEIRMDVTYNITDLEDCMPEGTTNVGLHSIQFQWFVTVQNRTVGSEDHGRFIWFGLSYFDKRYEFSELYAAQDGGKEHNTGAFIYMPDMKEILGEQGKTEIGKKMHVDVDILPIIKKAFSLAQERNYLTNSKWEDLYITSSNIGWEASGTYNASVTIDALNIKYK